MTVSTRSIGLAGAFALLAGVHGPPAGAEQEGAPQGVPSAAAEGVARAGQYDVPAGAPEAALLPHEQYGTTPWTISPVNSFAFVPFDPATVYGGDGFNGRFTVSGGTCYEAPVLLPTGSRLTAIGMDWCDTSNTAFLDAELYVCSAGSCTTPLDLSTSGLANGCYWSVVTGTGLNVDNSTTTYTLQVCTGGYGSATLFRTGRAWYQLQVSPAPSVATFPNDVPTSHPFFRFVEALAASGITGGCAAGSFCPDSPVTRGQMAVFLASALGMHFVN